MGVVDDAVEDGVGEGGFADDVMPFGDGQLAGDQDRGVLVAVLDDFHEVAALIGVETVRAPIVEDEEVGLCEGAKQAGIRLQKYSASQLHHGRVKVPSKFTNCHL